MKKYLILVCCVILSLIFGCSSEPKNNEIIKAGIISNPKILDFTNDPDNCGAEGYVCVGGRDCVDSRCIPAWITMTTTGAPAGRGVATAGTLNGKYILIGGCESTTEGSSPDGFCTNAATTWVGSEMIAWGGICDGTLSSVGGRYQPPAIQ